jgi:hypothetical protein
VNAPGGSKPSRRFVFFEEIFMSQDAVRQRPAYPQFRNDDSQQILGELIIALKPHPRGLRRWSVMRVMRENRRRLARDIPQKFEDDVERVFRRFCAGDAEAGGATSETAPFYRPRETAGEVWALHAERADTLIGDSAISPPR